MSAEYSEVSIISTGRSWLLEFEIEIVGRLIETFSKNTNEDV